MTKLEEAKAKRDAALDVLIDMYLATSTFPERVKARKAIAEADAAFERAVRDEEAEECARVADSNCSAEFCPSGRCECSADAIRARIAAREGEE